ncbi:Uncharacterised protein [Mycolicibacterium vanbaalenii]|uniref:Uncharacterized protein n=1 Tax=Mycolicibacterium vanbaalenii TaxID=110539 RepID=A0A5S9RB28_MYCVN|nr:hypothetical protein [Mycolicibacterium vanbaalenii]CAA0137484.1 Uncharacterised protein [Mycolicibacterium vanbaalenii]
MTLFRLDASIRVEGSYSRDIADIAEREWLAADAENRARELGRRLTASSATR